MARLGDIATVITKGTTPTSVGFEFANDGVNFVKIECIAEDGGFITSKFAHISDECNKKLARSQLKESDILFSIAGAIGRCAIVSKDILPANTNQALAIIRIPKGVIDCKYLLYFLSSPNIVKQFEKQKQGVAQLNLSLQNVSDFVIPIKLPKEQQRIVSVLDKLSNLISLRKQQLAKLDEAVKSVFIEMFGESRINPKGWEIIQLEKIAEVGSSKRVFVEELQEQGVPFYRGTEIGALAEDKNVIPELFITEEHYQSLCEATGTPAVGDLLMPSICPDGRIWLVDNDKPFYFKDGRVLWIHPTNRQIDSCYLLYVLKEKIMTDYESIASGTTFVELKIFALKALAIMLPPIEQQQQFSAFIAVIKKQRLTIQKSLDKLETLKNSLMQQYFG